MVTNPKPPKHFPQFPTRDNCDPTNPQEAFLWMLVALPGQNGAQLAMPVDYLQLVSERLWQCGARPVEEPTIKYQKPSATDPHWMTSPGCWTDLTTPDPVPRPAREALDRLSLQQRAELLRELLEEHRSDPT